MSQADLYVAAAPQHKSTLIIAPQFFVHLPTPKPNAWWRFWYWALLGWRWQGVVVPAAKPEEQT